MFLVCLVVSTFSLFSGLLPFYGIRFDVVDSAIKISNTYAQLQRIGFPCSLTMTMSCLSSRLCFFLLAVLVDREIVTKSLGY